MKTCSRCKQIKEYDKFFRDASRKDGYKLACKDCEKQYQQSDKAKKAREAWNKKNIISLDYAGRMDERPHIKRG